MCGCTANLKESKQGVVNLSVAKIMAEDFGSLLAWAWCINPQKVKDAFKNSTGLDISIDDLPTLVQANKLCNDTKLYKVDFKDVLNKIIFTQSEIENSACNYNINLPTA